jgi:hypothetical protein
MQDTFRLVGTSTNRVSHRVRLRAIGTKPYKNCVQNAVGVYCRIQRKHGPPSEPDAF